MLHRDKRRHTDEFGWHREAFASLIVIEITIFNRTNDVRERGIGRGRCLRKRNGGVSYDRSGRASRCQPTPLSGYRPNTAPGEPGGRLNLNIITPDMRHARILINLYRADNLNTWKFERSKLYILRLKKSGTSSCTRTIHFFFQDAVINISKMKQRRRKKKMFIRKYTVSLAPIST